MKIFESPKKKTQINLTALIDILFLLIIFFTVSMRFTDQSDLGIDLPITRSAEALSEKKKLILIMQFEDRVILNGRPVLLTDLENELKDDIYARDQSVILNIDKKISHGKVIRIMDLLKTNEFRKVLFGTKADS